MDKKIPFYYSDWFIYFLPYLSIIFTAAFNSPFPLILFLSPILFIILRKKHFTFVDNDFIKSFNTLEAIKKEIEKLQADYSKKNKELQESFAQKVEKLNDEYNLSLKKLNEEKGEIQSELDSINNDITIQYAGIDLDEDIASSEIKSKLELIKVEEANLIKNDEAVKIQASLSKKEANAQKRQILRSFNSEVGTLLSNITVKNTDKMRTKITQSYTALNKLYEIDGVSLTPDFLENKLQQLDLMHSYQLKLELEKEQQLAIKEQMMEEEKVRREIEQEKKKIAKEEKQFNTELSKMLSYLSKANNDIEKNIYAEKIKELEEKLQLLEKDKNNVLEREANTRAGFVYVISNIGSFGENVFKIGMTRRLEPMDRVKELGSASVPFEFDVHAMIFSDDAPALENMLHKEFRNYQMNKINSRKEFFKVDLQKIADVVKERFNATTEFTMTAKAEQYYESLKM